MKKPQSMMRKESALYRGNLIITTRSLNETQHEPLVMRRQACEWIPMVEKKFGRKFAGVCRAKFSNWNESKLIDSFTPDFLEVLQGTILELQVPLTPAQLIKYGQSFFLPDVSETLTEIVRRNCMSDARILPVKAVQMVMQTLSQWAIDHPEPELFILAMYLGHDDSFVPADSATTPAK